MSGGVTIKVKSNNVSRFHMWPGSWDRNQTLSHCIDVMGMPSAWACVWSTCEITPVLLEVRWQSIAQDHKSTPSSQNPTEDQLATAQTSFKGPQTRYRRSLQVRISEWESFWRVTKFTNHTRAGQNRATSRRCTPSWRKLVSTLMALAPALTGCLLPCLNAPSETSLFLVQSRSCCANLNKAQQD